MTSLLIIASVLLKNALARNDSALGRERGNQEETFGSKEFSTRDRICRRTDQAFSKQTCGAAAIK